MINVMSKLTEEEDPGDVASIKRKASFFWFFLVLWVINVSKMVKTLPLVLYNKLQIVSGFSSSGISGHEYK